MKTIRIFFAAIAAALAFSAAAQTVDISSLPKEAQASIQQQIAEKTGNKTSGVVEASAALRGETEKWAEVIVGAAVSGAQKANMVVDEFSKTTVGKVTIGIVAYKLIGKDAVLLLNQVIRYITGFGVMLLGCVVAYIFWLKTERMRTVEQTRELQPVLFGLTQRLVTVRKVRRVQGDNDWLPGIFISVACGIAVGAMVAFA
ncbi:hypothetical protein FDI24_gp204 [Acidovorax phage ACP17]|uniref:Uncharacterized protein n=1 Tax=Acidovorax phage ACP17 TaxID=2010329 RepID=A0A218M370_9CAUD|nr:hypothetical protein FDI24_gp204 [Acidovorax phage ACP17]ASD50485.1 hypothetical protein [Acidovorax phage ACP17]